MDAAIRLDHTFVAMETADAVHAMLELTFPEAPGAADNFNPASQFTKSDR